MTPSKTQQVEKTKKHGVASRPTNKQKFPVVYCPTHKAIRLRTLYVRGTRQEGQQFLHLGLMCPVCRYQELDEKVLTENY